jgi:hypothetical protein
MRLPGLEELDNFCLRANLTKKLRTTLCTHMIATVSLGAEFELAL